MLSVAIFIVKPSVVILSFIVQNIIVMSVVMLTVIVQNVIILSIVMLNVMAPFWRKGKEKLRVILTLNLTVRIW
jgi:hypothetical protein